MQPRISILAASTRYTLKSTTSRGCGFLLNHMLEWAYLKWNGGLRVIDFIRVRTLRG